MAYDNGNKNARCLAKLMTYWMSMSTQQASYYLKTFFHVGHSDSVIRELCRNRYFCFYHGNEDVVACSNSPFIKHSKGKEKCIWVFFRYLEMKYFKNMKLDILTMNEMQGVDFILNDKCYSLCYISPADMTYKSYLTKTRHDEKQKYLLVTDSKEAAAQIEKINSDDIIWYVSDSDNVLNIYKG